MKRYIARRLMQGVVLLFMVATIVFFLGRLTGNPVDLMLPEDATAEDRAAGFLSDHGNRQNNRGENRHASDMRFHCETP